LWAKSVIKHPEKHEATFLKMHGTD
jgi:hypothetical protein